ncbi:hypothetical protein B0I32_15119 [Nonomuraea fuscirosea]|uniref:Uncharacterized protein n=1 Tax=Nonomuraea fuscirosea TaxID=1291556 RepID=A0A2T0LMW4_9ACTN|nr:hypothetical protein B0I32_15119 [Nonomuraea fuscirosea]
MSPVDDILRHARAAYGDLRKPDYLFFRHAQENNPWAGLLKSLSARFKLEDWSDWEDGVGFSYAVRGRADSKRSWSLWLSAVGPYAFLCANVAETLRRQDVITSADVTDPDPAELVRELHAAGATLLTADEIETTVDFTSFEGKYPASTFVLLFGEEDVPWWHES